MSKLHRDLIRGVKWIEDIIEGEMIESRGYCKEYLDFPGNISQKDLSFISKILNCILEYQYGEGRGIRVMNSMGEIVPIHRKSNNIRG